MADSGRNERQRVSMDIGGTFTDFVFLDEATGSYETTKVSSTPADPAEGVLGGLDAVTASLDSVSFLVHGSTIAINTFLQRSGARTLLLATKGVEDVYLIARGSRARMYDHQYRKPTPLLPRADIVPIGGRFDHRGNEIEPLDEGDVRAAIERARDDGFGAVAVSLLFSFLNPAHELRVGELIREALPDIPVSLSHNVAREWREYERTSSTVLDAYVGVSVKRYLNRLGRELDKRKMPAPLHVMQSSGGVMTAAAVGEKPLLTLLSGPVGGSMGGVALAELLDRPNLICIDMGGTSFDVSLIANGEADYSSEASLEGFPVLIPIVNIHTIGAGGGSIAYSEGGGLRVGPQSAGAIPGPACYGRGGTRPTVTDANLALGRIDPSYFLGGRMSLDTAAAESAIADLAAELALEPLHLAEGIIEVVNAKMAQAIRTITVEKGIEPRDFSIVAYGGAGPMHAAFLAQELEIDEVIVPASPGTFSAWGMLQALIRHDFVRPYYRAFDQVDRDDLVAIVRELEEEAFRMLELEGVPAADRRSQPSVEMRYEGQEYTLNVPAELDGADLLSRLASAFHTTYRVRYGHASVDAPLEIVAIRLAALGDLGRPTPRTLEQGEAQNGSARTYRPIIVDRKEYDATIVERAELAAGDTVDGPAIIEEPTATTVVPPGATLTADLHGPMLIRLGTAG